MIKRLVLIAITPKATRTMCGANCFLFVLDFEFVLNFLAQFPPFKPTSAPSYLYCIKSYLYCPIYYRPWTGDLRFAN
jgi:hypothetical protein